MKKMLWCAALVVMSLAARAQDPTPLTRAELNKLFPEAVKTQFGIRFPVFKAFAYQDQTGTNYVLLTESQDSIVHDGPELDTISRAIKAICLKANSNGYTKNWEVNDFIDPKNEELSIWFWSKSSSFKDLDGDGLVEPFVAYSTAGLNGGSDGRLKLILFYKGKKIAIRHQNSELDGGRVTEVDAAFYALPVKVQQQGIAILKRIADNDEAIFATDWQKAMAKHKTTID